MQIATPIMLARVVPHEFSRFLGVAQDPQGDTVCKPSGYLEGVNAFKNKKPIIFQRHVIHESAQSSDVGRLRGEMNAWRFSITTTAKKSAHSLGNSVCSVLVSVLCAQCLRGGHLNR